MTEPVPQAPKEYRIKLKLNQLQKERIINQFNCKSLSTACESALTQTTGIEFPPKYQSLRKEKLLVFDLQNTPLYEGRPVTRKDIQRLLGVTRAAVHNIVQDTRRNSFCVRKGYVFRLSP
ncbi:MAG: MarR family transcriptional regulator [Candidatus Electrothrix sp. ATG2]|nr:MarR family transcriptional regulator [Candidatus Electrothrix sp. ATG2]